jgi:hypothetical protein
MDMAVSTTYNVEQFLAATRATIQARGIPSGLEAIRHHVEHLLANPTLLQDYIGNPVPYRERTTIGYDPETDVHVLVHGREKGGQSAPHDHGPCWVVYGQYKHYTDMTRWKRLDSGGTAGHAELTVQKQFRLNAGEAAAFAKGDIHSIAYGDDTFFIRVTGGDVEKQKTLRFNLEKQTVEVEDRAQRPQ